MARKITGVSMQAGKAINKKPMEGSIGLPTFIPAPIW
jgi:hypothetical protein